MAQSLSDYLMDYFKSNPAPAPQPDQVSTQSLSDLVRGAPAAPPITADQASLAGLKHSALFGGDDEIGGIGGAVGNYLGRNKAVGDPLAYLLSGGNSNAHFDPGTGQGFSADMERERAAESRFGDEAWKQQPLAYGEGTAVGLIPALALPVGKIAEAATPLARYGQMAAVGAGYGALGGALSADPGDRLAGGAEGAAIGAVASPILGKIADKIAARFGPKVAEEAVADISAHHPNDLADQDPLIDPVTGGINVYVKGGQPPVPPVAIHETPTVRKSVVRDPQTGADVVYNESKTADGWKIDDLDSVHGYDGDGKLSSQPVEALPDHVRKYYNDFVHENHEAINAPVASPTASAVDPEPVPTADHVPNEQAIPVEDIHDAVAKTPLPFDPEQAQAQRERLGSIGQPPLDPRLSTPEGAPDTLTFPNGKVSDIIARDEAGLRAHIANQGIPQAANDTGNVHIPGPAAAEPTPFDQLKAEHGNGANPPPPPEPPVPPSGEPPEPDPKYVGSVNTHQLGIEPDAIKILRDNPPEKTVRTREEIASAAADIPGVPKLPDISATLWAGREKTASGLTEALDLARTHGVDSPEYRASVIRLADTVGVHSGNAAEWGRGGNALRQEILGKKGGGLAPGDVNAIAQAMADPEKAAIVDDLLDKHKNDPDVVVKVLNDLKKPGFGDYFFSTMYAMQLSGVKTQLKNVIGNALNLGNDILLDHGLASVFGQARRFQGGGYRTSAGDADRVLGREVAARIYGAIKGSRDALGYWKDGVRVPGTMGRAYKLSAPLDHVVRGNVPNVDMKGLDFGPRSLAAADEFFRSAANLSELYGQSFRSAYQDGVRGTKNLFEAAEKRVNDPDQAALKQAKDYALRMRFQDPPGWIAKGIQTATSANEKDSLPVRAGKGALRVIVPYVRTPDSIARTAIRHSPFGVADSVNLAGLKAGGAERDLAMARIAVGSSVSGAIANYAYNGGITGMGPSDPRKRADLMATGWRPNSIHVGKEYIPYDGALGPLGTTIATVATAVERYKEAPDDKSYADLTAKIGLGMGDAMSHNGWTDGLSRLFETIGDDSEAGVTKVKQFLSQTMTGLVTPAILRDANKAFFDATPRDTRDNDSLTGMMESGLEAAVPGLSTRLPQRHDVLGQTEEKPESAVSTLTNPFSPQPESNDPAARELGRLLDIDPKHKSLLGPAPKTVNIPGLGPSKLNAKDYQNYQAVSGGYIRFGMQDLMKDPSWKLMDDDSKRAAIKQVAKDGRAFARQQLFDGMESNPPQTAPAANPIVPAAKAAEAPAAPAPEAPSPEPANTFTAGVPTSMRRTVKGNREVGGVSNSDHLRGDAIDFVPAKGWTMSQLEVAARGFFGKNAKVLNEGTHVHVHVPGLNAPLYGHKGIE